jgi:cbb3-type cytochrome oxidase subunit 3
MTLKTIAWLTVVLIAVVAYALLTAQDHRGGDE